MLTCNAEEVQESLLDYRDELEQRLIKMVAGFAGELSQRIAEETKVGNAEKYAALYETRYDEYGIEPREGFHAGSWTYSETGNIVFDPTIHPMKEVGEENYREAYHAYNLGETFYIAGKGPAFGRQIMMEDIQVAYSFDFKRLFNRKY